MLSLQAKRVRMRDPAVSADVPRIAIVEDESIIALGLERRLAKLGFHVVGIADSGEDAVALAEKSAPDLILMDIRLGPGMDGIEAAAIIRDRFAIPVVYLTSHADAATLRRAGASGAYGYCAKPFEDYELATSLDMAWQRVCLERHLHDRERWMAITLGNLAEGVLTADASGRIRFMNAVAEEVLGIGEAQAVGCELGAIYRYKHDASLAAGNNDGGREVVLLEAAGGRTLPVEHNLSHVVDDAGQAVGTVAVFRDVSSRLRVQRELRESVSQLRLALEATVNALTVTSEKRDPFTAGHQERVSRLAFALAELLGLSEVRREGLRLAGLVHDIGKIHVPSEILAKPETLSTMEMEVVRDHCQVGYEILKDIPFPWPVARMVLEHHERVDGSGYPGGLTGEKLLLESRILAVADVVEAMHSHRPYRAALGREAALDEICSRRGTAYDPDVVDACLLLFERDGFAF